MGPGEGFGDTEVTSAVEGAPASRRSAARAALIVGMAGMIAGAAFFALSIVSTDGGATTPVAAVERLFQALGDEDVLGVLESLLSGEREMLQGPLLDIAKELSRLGILAGDPNLTDLDGLELEFFGLRFTSEELAPGVAAVRLREGRMRSRFDPGGGLLGAFVTDLIPQDARSPGQASQDFGEGEVVFATVREGDEWYVSLGYSIAENARRGADRVAPTFGQGVAIGAATPEGAVDRLLRAVASLDVSGLIQLMPPDEARALHDYVQLFIAQVGPAAHNARGFFRAQINDLDLSSRTDGDRATVKVEKIAFTYELLDLGVSIEYDGECAVYRVEGERPERDCGTGIGPTLPLFLPIEELPHPDVGFVVVREGGEWYVSPTRTVLDGVLGYLKVMEPGHLDAIREFFEYGFSEEFVPSVEPLATPTA